MSLVDRWYLPVFWSTFSQVLPPAPPAYWEILAEFQTLCTIFVFRFVFLQSMTVDTQVMISCRNDDPPLVSPLQNFPKSLTGRIWWILDGDWSALILSLFAWFLMTFNNSFRKYQSILKFRKEFGWFLIFQQCCKQELI